MLEVAGIRNRTSDISDTNQRVRKYLQNTFNIICFVIKILRFKSPVEGHSLIIKQQVTTKNLITLKLEVVLRLTSISVKIQHMT